jgi:hypothetical protein
MRPLSKWKRWLKILLRIDPLVGMYFVTYVSGAHPPNMGMVVGRIETGAEPKYLLRYFCMEGWDWPGDDDLIVDLWSKNGCWCTLHETRKEAQEWWEWRSNNAARQRLAARDAAPDSWEPPRPERLN